MTAVVVQQRFVVVRGDKRTAVVKEKASRVVVMGRQGLPGRDGAGSISTDAGNAIVTGSDDGLYAPDALPTDPLAYYILARS